ncbi:disintegrin and metalloproteinase domain-containing protein 11 isoform X2 [Erpetoichthys calabaricus]|uniref:disintegrin and metalloproteinase domain-containing protein 11 isoform X2 n=1 Tax=Erpetoichthys calabaricus TaxID=27687 RepID=UPI0022349EFF|nr:disintegrin and metalloproteinase domain-containing protein 11 isoform X2 [Erpetoichthys calabaricus]
MIAVRWVLFAAASSGVTLSASSVLSFPFSGLGGPATSEVGVGGEVTRPRRLLRHGHTDDEVPHGRLDTRVGAQGPGTPPIHVAQASFLVNAFGQSFILDLELNHHLLSSKYIERHFEGTQAVQTEGGEHCYYHGEVRKAIGSFVALSTCQGLHGVFSDGNVTYIIQPTPGSSEQDADLHVIYQTPGLLRLSPPCPDCPDDDDDDEGLLSDARDLSNEPQRRSKRQVSRVQHTVQSETKYIELMVVNDRRLFEQFRLSSVLTRNFAKAVVNLADMIYKEQLNTRIVLVAMETWASGDLVPIADNPLVTLQDFMKYRVDSIKEHSDAVHLFSGKTFRSSRSGTAYIGGICSLSRGGGVNEYGNVGSMAITLSQSLGQNIGMMWNKQRSAAGECKCPDSWLGCIMEDTGYYLPKKFSRCSIDEYSRFLQDGGGSCLFNKPLKLLDPPECGNGFVETGEECDCGSPMECARSGGLCCKKCTLTHDAMCSNGLCCQGCKYEPRGVVCREAVNDCDVPESCTGDSSQCPANVHKLDGYGCEAGQGRCYNGQCKTRDGQCRSLWGHSSADRICYEKLNTEGTEKGNCGREGDTWVQCNKQDVLCGFLFCNNISGAPRYGDLSGDVTSVTIYHQNKYLDCRGGHAMLDDGTDLGYVDDGTLCGPNMMCLDHRCLPLSSFNLSTCPGSMDGRICSEHGVCSNEVKCICDRDWTGTDCSVYDPIPKPKLPGEPEKYKDLEERSPATRCAPPAPPRLPCLDEFHSSLSLQPLETLWSTTGGHVHSQVLPVGCACTPSSSADFSIFFFFFFFPCWTSLRPEWAGRGSWGQQLGWGAF